MLKNGGVSQAHSTASAETLAETSTPHHRGQAADSTGQNAPLPAASAALLGYSDTRVALPGQFGLTPARFARKPLLPPPSRIAPERPFLCLVESLSGT